MSRLDDDMIDPEFAELAVLVYAERPEPDPEFARALDATVARRFEAAPRSGAAARRLRLRVPFTWKAGVGSLAAGLAVAVLVVVIGSGGGAQSGLSVPAETRAVPTTASSAAGAATGATPTVGAQSKAPSPPPNGRKIIQSAQLALTTAPDRVEDVAQQVFDVIGHENGIVRRSSITQTGGLDGGAEFALSVPSASLSETMTALSRLRGANVASRTDATTDVNDRYVSLGRRLADARALRAGLLRQLAQATTQTEVDSLHARIADAEASIASLEAQLRALGRAVTMSQIALTINAAQTPVAHGTGSSSFTLGTAAHDAGRVLTVAAGVALIALAALVPLALVGAAIAWVIGALRHRRRERALDLA